MNKKQFFAVWIIFFVFSAIAGYFVIESNDARLESYAYQYMRLSGMSWSELSGDAAYLAEHRVCEQNKRFALFSFVFLNLGIAAIYALRRKEPGEKAGFENMLKLALILIAAAWIIYWIFVFTSIGGDKTAWLLSPTNWAPVIAVLALLAALIVVAQWGIDEA